MKQKQIKGTVHRTAIEAEAPVYYECPACGFLSADPRFGAGEIDCPVCAAPPDARRTFPPERLRRLDSRIRAYEADGDSEIVVILAAAFLETLLEDILDRIMETRGADVAIRSAVLDTQRAVGQRISRLYPMLTGEQFEDTAEELGFREFPRRWRAMRAMRNSFIHDTPYGGAQERIDAETATEAMILLDQAYKLFVLINNRFVADPGRRERIAALCR